jgi:hypothetical protein
MKDYVTIAFLVSELKQRALDVVEGYCLREKLQ